MEEPLLDKQTLVALVPTIGAVLLAALGVLDRWLHRRQLLRAPSPLIAAAIEAEAKPPRLPGAGASALLLLAFSLAFCAPPQLLARAAPGAGRGCSSDADCEPPARCSQNRCVADAKKGPRPKRPVSAPIEADLALWWRPREERRDPAAPPLPLARLY